MENLIRRLIPARDPLRPHGAPVTGGIGRTLDAVPGEKKSARKTSTKRERCSRRAPPSGGLSAAAAAGAGELARLEVLVALALRHAPPGEVIQLLTWHVAGARELAGVLAWRLGRVISAARRPHVQVHADEDGARYAAMLAVRAGNTPTPGRLAAIAAARAAAEAAQQRFSGRLGVS